MFLEVWRTYGDGRRVPGSMAQFALRRLTCAQSQLRIISLALHLRSVRLVTANNSYFKFCVFSLVLATEFHSLDKQDWVASNWWCDL